MAGGIQGADLAQLQHLVQQLGGPFQSELQATLNGMNQKVQASSSYWVARNADQFRNDFAQFVSKCEQQLNQILAGGREGQRPAPAGHPDRHRLGHLTPARPHGHAAGACPRAMTPR